MTSSFPEVAPIYGAQESITQKTRIVRFADGYEHRIAFGLQQHQNPRVLNHTYRAEVGVINTLENFLQERAQDKFSFTLLPNDQSKFVCENFTVSFINPSIKELKAAFREVFEP